MEHFPLFFFSTLLLWEKGKKFSVQRGRIRKLPSKASIRFTALIPPPPLFKINRGDPLIRKNEWSLPDAEERMGFRWGRASSRPRWFCRFNEKLCPGEGLFRENSLLPHLVARRFVRQGDRHGSRWYIGPIPRSNVTNPLNGLTSTKLPRL